MTKEWCAAQSLLSLASCNPHQKEQQNSTEKIQELHQKNTENLQQPQYKLENQPHFKHLQHPTSEPYQHSKQQPLQQKYNDKQSNTEDYLLHQYSTKQLITCPFITPPPSDDNSSNDEFEDPFHPSIRSFIHSFSSNASILSSFNQSSNHQPSSSLKTNKTLSKLEEV